MTISYDAILAPAISPTRCPAWEVEIAAWTDSGFLVDERAGIDCEGEYVSTIALFDGLSIAEFDGFALPLPVICRGSGKRKWEAAVTRWSGRVSAVGVSGTDWCVAGLGWAGLPGGEIGSADGEAVPGRRDGGKPHHRQRHRHGR